MGWGMSDFTKGPWCVSKQSPRIIQKDYSDIGSDNGFLIASTMGHDQSGFYASVSEADANAKLIAVSPDLYAMAEMVLSWWEERQYDTCSTGDGDERNIYDDEPDFVIAAKAALKKVKGE